MESKSDEKATSDVLPSGMPAAHVEDRDKAHVRHFEAQDEAWRKQREKQLLRKIDAHLLPFLILMYLLNFLDRSNLAQARQGTLERDLGMSGTDFNLATSIFFVAYLLMQLPSNLLITRVRPSIYLGAAMTLWGVVSTCNAAVHNFTGLVLVRFFLGFVEAPFFPGAVFLMSSWYTRAELTRRISWFYSGNALANMFGGVLGASILGNLNGARGIAGWRWLFIVVCLPFFSGHCSADADNLAGRHYYHLCRHNCGLRASRLPAHNAMAKRRREGICRLAPQGRHQRGR